MCKWIGKKLANANGPTSNKFIWVLLKKIGNNFMESEDVHYLAKAKWTTVTVIDIGILCWIKGWNDWKKKGCSYLRETAWPQLRSLSLCKYSLILMEITFRMKDVSTSAMKSGPSSSKLIWVIKEWIRIK